MVKKMIKIGFCGNEANEVLNHILSLKISYVFYVYRTATHRCIAQRIEDMSKLPRI